MFISRDDLDCRDVEDKIFVLLSKFETLKKNFSFSSQLNEILQRDSLLASQNFERKKLIFSLSIIPSISLPILYSIF